MTVNQPLVLATNDKARMFSVKELSWESSPTGRIEATCLDALLA